MPDRDKPDQIRAAGAVLWRPGPEGPQVAIVHRPRYDDWSLPKGKSLPGEHVLVTAVREVCEETGVRIDLGRRLSPASYLSDGRPKRVDYWAARPDPDGDGSGPPAAPAGFVPNDEVDDLAWLPVTAAVDRLTYPHDTDVLADFASGPAGTVAILLVRHTSAQSKEAWQAAGHPDDLARPLTPEGDEEAQRLGRILRCFGPARVVSSPAQRCLASVRPYAALAGTEVEPEPSFGLGPEDASGAATWTAVSARQRAGELVAAREPVVICAHRENLPSLLTWICEDLGAPVPAGPELPKGAFWALHTSDGKLAAAEQHGLEA